MTSVIIDAGTLAFSATDLTATGLLVPFGVPARSNLGVFTFAAGDITLPEDLTGMTLNVEHKREHVAGGITALHEQSSGIVGTFSFANTARGRQAYADAKSGKRKNLSAEIANVRIKDGKALPGAELFGSAVVEVPAFEGATLLAAADTELDLPAVLVPDESGTLSILADALPDQITVTTPDGAAADYEPTPEPIDPEPTTEEFSAMTTKTAAVPTTLLASSAPTPVQHDLGTIFASIASIKNGAPDAADATTLLAALADIKAQTTGGLTTANGGVIPPNWVGQLWQGKSYVQKFISLGTRAFGGISLGGRKGFVLDQGTALVQSWAGNKADIPTGTASTSTKSASRRQYGWGADFAREWFDLDGGAEVIEALMRGVMDSYAKITDLDALGDIMTQALLNLNAPGTAPTGYPATLAMLIDAVEAVQDSDDDPTFLLVNRAAWRELIQTPKDHIPEFVTFDFSTGGEGNADKVQVRRAPDSAFVGLDATQPAVAAGAGRGIEFRELGETPIKMEALDIARGGVDKAVIGYLETFVQRPESFVAFGTDAP